MPGWAMPCRDLELAFRGARNSLSGCGAGSGRNGEDAHAGTDTFGGPMLGNPVLVRAPFLDQLAEHVSPTRRARCERRMPAILHSTGDCLCCGAVDPTVSGSSGAPGVHRVSAARIPGRPGCPGVASTSRRYTPWRAAGCRPQTRPVGRAEDDRREIGNGNLLAGFLAADEWTLSPLGLAVGQEQGLSYVNRRRRSSRSTYVCRPRACRDGS